MESTTLFIPDGYGKGDIIKDLDGNPWVIGEPVCAPIRQVTRIEKEVAEKLLEQGAQLLVSTR